jgi:hypothetical protein
MTAAPAIEAVRRAGRTILVRGAQLRLAAPAPLPDPLIAEGRQDKAETLDLLGTAAPPLPEGVIAERFPVETSIECWRRGVERLSPMASPANYLLRAWTQLAVDAERFLTGGEHRRHVSAGRPGSCSGVTGTRLGAGNQSGRQMLTLGRPELSPFQPEAGAYAGEHRHG